MEKNSILVLILVLSTIMMASTRCRAYYSPAEPYVPAPQKLTHLHFFLHDTLSGKHPTSVPVARPNTTDSGNASVPLGSVLVVHDPITISPDITSEVIGNAQGLVVFTDADGPTLMLYMDFGFTKGEYNGSSISVFSRNPIMETDRELAVVGGRGKFRMAKGFAQVKTYFANMTTGDAIVEYKVTVIH